MHEVLTIAYRRTPKNRVTKERRFLLPLIRSALGYEAGILVDGFLSLLKYINAKGRMTCIVIQ